MARLWTPNDQVQEATVQTFMTSRHPDAALDAAEVYLEGAGMVAPKLRGDMQRDGDDLVVHHGRITTRVSVEERPEGSRVAVTRKGRAPLEETRAWIVGMGLVGFVLAWGLAWYNSAADDALSPMVTITFFFLGIFATVVLLYVIDHSLEKRSASLCRSLEDAINGDPLRVLRREIDGLERNSSIANGVLFYCAGILVQFLVFVIVLSEGVRDGIDEAAALAGMRAVFGIPIIPAVLFALLWFYGINRRHEKRLRAVEQRFEGRLVPLPQ